MSWFKRIFRLTQTADNRVHGPTLTDLEKAVKDRDTKIRLQEYEIGRLKAEIEKLKKSNEILTARWNAGEKRLIPAAVPNPLGKSKKARKRAKKAEN